VESQFAVQEGSWGWLAYEPIPHSFCKVKSKLLSLIRGNDYTRQQCFIVSLLCILKYDYKAVEIRYQKNSSLKSRREPLGIGEG
jgi:hypothetical protein